MEHQKKTNSHLSLWAPITLTWPKDSKVKMVKFTFLTEFLVCMETKAWTQIHWICQARPRSDTNS